MYQHLFPIHFVFERRKADENMIQKNIYIPIKSKMALQCSGVVVDDDNNDEDDIFHINYSTFRKCSK